MDGGDWFIGIVALAGLLVVFALSFVPAYGRWRALRHAQRMAVGLPAHLERSVSRRLMARDRGASLGGIIFTALAILAFHFEVGVSDDSNLTALFVLGALFAGVGAGAAVTALLATNRLPAEQPRVARSGAVTVSDYLAPLELVGARLVVAVAVVALVLSSVVSIPGADGSRFAVAFFAIFGAIALAMFEVASRRIVDRPQPAGSTAELVWDDAIRASSLRDLVTAPLALGSYCLIFGALDIAEGSSNSGATVVAYTVAATFALALIVAGIVSVATRPQQHFKGRLWPNLRLSDTADAAADAA